MQKKLKGFTLIELLVVIAIIGILSSIVLVSVNSARQKAKEVAIKSNIAGTRVAAEMRYDADGDYDAWCGSAEWASVNQALTAQSAANLLCADTANQWCVAANYSSTGAWCADYTGFVGAPTVACAAASEKCK